MLCESNLLKTVQSRLERLYVVKLDTATKRRQSVKHFVVEIFFMSLFAVSHGVVLKVMTNRVSIKK